MNVKRIMAALLAVAAAGTVAVTAFADAEVSAPDEESVKAAWGEKKWEPFKKLLDEGVVSQDAYDRMEAYLKENMSGASRSGERVNILDALLKDGIITQDEYDALKNAVSKPEKSENGLSSFRERRKSSDGAKFENPFEKCVEEGLISQKTADAIKEYLKAKMPERNGDRQHLDVFSKMLESEVITQSEYDAIKAALSEYSASVKRSRSAGDNK